MITSLNDNLIIKDVKINKGKCGMALQREIRYNPNVRDYVIVQKKLPLNVKEFESLRFDVSIQCNILKLDIETNDKIWPFESN